MFWLERSKDVFNFIGYNHTKWPAINPVHSLCIKIGLTACLEL